MGSIKGQREETSLVCIEQLFPNELLAACEFGEEGFANLLWSLLMERGGLMECPDARFDNGNAGFEESPCRLTDYARHFGLFWIVFILLLGGPGEDHCIANGKAMTSKRR